jgi:hypothetical protein
MTNNIKPKSKRKKKDREKKKVENLHEERD